MKWQFCTRAHRNDMKFFQHNKIMFSIVFSIVLCLCIPHRAKMFLEGSREWKIENYHSQRQWYRAVSSSVLYWIQHGSTDWIHTNKCIITIWCCKISAYAFCVLQHVWGIHVKAESDISIPAGLPSISGFANYPLPVKLGQNERASTYFSVKSCISLNRQASENKP